MGLLETIGSALGLGQKDIAIVTRSTLERVNRVNMISKEQRDGVALGLSAMLDDLRMRDVITSNTHQTLVDEVKVWHADGKVRKTDDPI